MKEKICQEVYEPEFLELEEDIFCSLADGFDSSHVDAVTGKGKRKFARQQYELTAGRKIEVLPENQDGCQAV